MHKPKVILVIMDGWGYSPIKKGNAILSAKLPTFDYLWNNYAHTLLNAFGQNVGLPWGSIGSSEVGHTSLGSGRLVSQELTLIDREIANKKFFQNEKLKEIIKKTQQANKAIHLLGLVSDGGVHSHQSHIYALLELLSQENFKSNIYIHVFTDGRDSGPQNAMRYINELEKKISKAGIDAKIATLCGRYYSMDRDKRWERTKIAYEVLTQNNGDQVQSIHEGLKQNYSQNITDEFIKPMSIELREKKGLFSKLASRSNSTPKYAKIEAGDGLIFFNIRPDRMRQIVSLFLEKNPDSKTEPVPNVNILTLTTYDERFPVMVSYPVKKVDNPLAKILSDHKINQGHFAETEKYAHVTYFFDGGHETPFPQEFWHFTPSKKVATYDLAPEMSAKEITDQLLENVEKEKLDFVLVNYANTDMVGHTGVFDAVVKAAETIDEQLKRLMVYLPETTILVTADHGNAECMIHPETGEIDKKHSVNPVPFIVVNEKFKRPTDPTETPMATGILADITTTILYLFDLEPSKEMSGVNLLDTIK